jgi:hypothetical protein
MVTRTHLGAQKGHLGRTSWKQLSSRHSVSPLFGSLTHPIIAFLAGPMDDRRPRIGRQLLEAGEKMMRPRTV